MADSVDPDQTAPQEQSDQGLHYMLRSVCPNIIKKFYNTALGAREVANVWQ